MTVAAIAARAKTRLIIINLLLQVRLPSRIFFFFTLFRWSGIIKMRSRDFELNKTLYSDALIIWFAQEIVEASVVVGIWHRTERAASLALARRRRGVEGKTAGCPQSAALLCEVLSSEEFILIYVYVSYLIYLYYLFSGEGRWNKNTADVPNNPTIY